MNTRSLRFRLVVWYAGSLTVLFAAFGVFNYTSLKSEMEKSTREALARRARQVAATVQRSTLGKAELDIEIQNHFAPEVNNRFTRVTVDGEEIYMSGQPADRGFVPDIVPPPSQLITNETFERRVLPDGTALFVFVLPRISPTKHLIAEEGTSVEPFDTALHNRVVGLVVGLALLIAVAATGGYLLVDRAVKPVDQIIKSAEQISSRNLGERLPVPQTGDELERLSNSLNHMIRRLEEAVQQNQRFLADASHELRTPLTILKGELEAVAAKNERDGGSESLQFVDSSLEEVERLQKIVEALFAISRLDAGEAQEESRPVDLGDLAATTADQISLLAEDKQIHITCRCPSGIMVRGDRARLKQVLVNLLDNAIKFTPTGGTVKVNVSARDHKAVLEVLDTGMGIPRDALAKIFERFYRVDNARSRDLGGAGLGLSIVKSICTAHEGRVEARSEPGQGSCFTVELPLISTAV